MYFNSLTKNPGKIYFFLASHLILIFDIQSAAVAMAPFWVWWDTFKLALVCVYKRVVFLIDPEQRKKDLEE